MTTLPRDFVFGVATSATQIEGAADEDGRTPSIWDWFAGLPGRISDGSHPGVTCDHYHRWQSDVALLHELGVDAYRFSVSWSRILPGGTGPVNHVGIDFYSRLIDALLEAGIAPWLTLFHWDMPFEVMESGGWLDRSSVDSFERYAQVAADAWGDRVAAWMTLNEPVVHTGYGYALGVDAPGLTLFGGAFQAAHHQLLAHGRATQILRSTPGMVGIVNNHTAVTPASDADEDRLAAGIYELYHNAQYTQPLFGSGYPEALAMLPGAAWDCIEDGDLAEIAQPLDFYGVNYYQPTVVAAAPDNVHIPFTLMDPQSGPITDSGWTVDPSSLAVTLRNLHLCYPTMPPIYITENGCAFRDDVGPGAPSPDEPLQDLNRMEFLDTHLDAVADAIGDGVDVRGYFHWSLMDNWEWAEGFTQPFGLVRVEPGTLRRVPRASFHHYKRRIAGHRTIDGRAAR